MVLSAACAAPEQSFDVNSFAHAYKAWADRMNSIQSGAIDAKEVAAWQDTKREWKQLEKYIDRIHRGE